MGLRLRLGPGLGFGAGIGAGLGVELGLQFESIVDRFQTELRLEEREQHFAPLPRLDWQGGMAARHQGRH